MWFPGNASYRRQTTGAVMTIDYRDTTDRRLIFDEVHDARVLCILFVQCHGKALLR